MQLPLHYHRDIDHILDVIKQLEKSARVAHTISNYQLQHELMFAEDIKDITKNNTNFRKVLFTGVHSQIVAMSIPVGGDIGEETHDDGDQILYFVQGKCEAVLNGELRTLDKHDIIHVPAGVRHNFTNVGDEDLKLFTVYAPPHHPDGTVHMTKADAQQAEAHEVQE